MPMTKEKLYKEKEDIFEKEIKPSEELIQSLLFKQVEKPKNVTRVKIVNVFDNKYRINVWVEIFEDNLTKNKIAQSYFAKFLDNSLVIIDSSDAKKE